MASDFERRLRQYAELAIRVGLNLRAGQRLLIRAPLSTAPLVRLLGEQAYQAGARLVDVLWTDEDLDLARFRHAPRDSFDEFSEWRASGLLEAVRRGDGILTISADNPDLLKDQDPALVALAQQTTAKNLRPALELLSRNATSWLVISAPTPGWAAKVFPDAPPDQREERLWSAIFEVCRMDQADPVEAWRAHIARLTASSDYLNRKRYAALKYTAPGTDLTIGLPRDHLWVSAQSTSENGIRFTPNMPTEEVFTIPHRAQASGFVTASKPLNYRGALIDGFRVTFAEGRVVEASATTGAEHLRRLLDSDEGARHLGEVALVPASSPIASSGRLFYNTLFDENAASHVALGRAYRFTLKDGEGMSTEQFAQAGGNDSMIHVDFMIGSGQMDIDGIAADGTAEPVMRGGEWAFELP